MSRPYDAPSRRFDGVLRAHPRGGMVQAAIVDFHAEATSEKMGAGHFCDGRASLVVGTHTHVPTADAQILRAAPAYLSDAGNVRRLQQHQSAWKRPSPCAASLPAWP